MHKRSRVRRTNLSASIVLPFVTGLILCGTFFLGSVITGGADNEPSVPPPDRTDRTVECSYAFTVKIPPEARQVLLWAPLPKSNGHQEVSKLQVTSDYPYTFQTEKEYGNQILKMKAAGELPESLQVKISFVVARKAYRALGESDGNIDPISNRQIKRFLSPDRLIPIDGKIAAEARQVVRDDMSGLEKARALYDHVVSTLKYDKTGTGWGRGDALYACDARRGNCSDFHSLFIGMARSVGIPARFVMGFPLPDGKTEGEIPGYHCWAEFYLDGVGWVPVDASEASKHPEKRKLLFGGLDANRIEFTLGRDIRLASGMEPLNFFIYPLARVDGKKDAAVNWNMRFRELSIEGAVRTE